MSALEATTSDHELQSSNVTGKKCTNGNKVTVEFPDRTFVFHSQWLHDARCDDGAARNAETALCRQSAAAIHVESVRISDQGAKATLDVTWDGGRSSIFPLRWLRMMASSVAAEGNGACRSASRRPAQNKGWTAEALEIPEISYHDLFRDVSPAQYLSTLSVG